MPDISVYSIRTEMASSIDFPLVFVDLQLVDSDNGQILLDFTGPNAINVFLGITLMDDEDRDKLLRAMKDVFISICMESSNPLYGINV
jgi:hypothetical protein